MADSVAVYVFNGTGWVPLTVTGGTPVSFIPPPRAVYVFNGVGWVPWNGTAGGSSQALFTPPPCLVNVFNTTWAPLAGTGGTAASFTPPSSDFYAFNGVGWVPWNGIGGTAGSTVLSYTPSPVGAYAAGNVPWNGSNQSGPPAGTYIVTTFNEAAAGTNLAGTTPAIIGNGAIGPWTLASGTDFTYQSGGGILATTTNTNYDLIDSGQTNETVRFTVSSIGTAVLGQVVVRYTDQNNLIAINICNGSANCNGSSTGYALFDVVGGVATGIGSGVTSAPTGNYTVVLSGTSITVTGPTGSASGTTANTGTKIGAALRIGPSFGLSSLSAKSN